MKKGALLLLLLSLCIATCTGQVKVGYNQNWSYLPPLDTKLMGQIEQLKPQVLRYPGGTLAHSWDWRKGVVTKRKAKAAHPISDIKRLVESTHAEFVFVLDVVSNSVEDQIAMLEAIESEGVPIKYIELGNELYAKDGPYVERFPTGADYARVVAEWVPQLRARFPQSKIAALLLGRKVRPQNRRAYEWNSLVVPHTIDLVDGYTYHLYIPEKGGFEDLKSNFEEVRRKAKTGDKELWITEYGNKNGEQTPRYLTDLALLSDYVESLPRVTLALSHQIIGNNKNKLSPTDYNFTPEGEMFSERHSKRR